MVGSLRISILTPSYQQARFLPECLASVAQQAYPVREHIVVDGGSTDGSTAILQRTNDLAWWCSEADAGQSDAINKGLARAKGEVFTWVNSDDALLPNALDQVAEAFTAQPELQVFGGQVIHRSGAKDLLFPKLNDAMDEAQLFADPVVNQPATYWRTSTVRDIGGVDSALRYVMDLELWWQMLFRHGPQNLRFVPVPLAIFRLHEESKTVTAHGGFLCETATLLHGLCMATDQPAYARALALGHDLCPALRGIPAGPQHALRVRSMVLHFVLKWYHRVEHYAHWRMFNALAKCPDVDAAVPPKFQDRWKQVRQALSNASWTLFRARRKLAHLWS
jgi:glycosyltransferase involved in cell wall biosynthesis